MTKMQRPDGSALSEGLGLAPERDAVLAQLDDRTNQTWAGKRARWARLVRAQDAEIIRAWAARDAAVTDLEAHAEAEVRRAVATERARLLPEREVVGQLLCSVVDNLGDMPVSDEWAAKTAKAAHELLVRNDYFRA